MWGKENNKRVRVPSAKTKKEGFVGNAGKDLDFHERPNQKVGKGEKSIAWEQTSGNIKKNVIEKKK